MKKHKRHLPTCRAVNKKRYANQDAAIRAAIRVDMIDAGHRPMNAYRCEACGDWHIGHLPRVLPTKPAPAAVLELPPPPPTPSTSVDVARCECQPCKKKAQGAAVTPTGIVNACRRHLTRLHAAHPQQGMA